MSGLRVEERDDSGRLTATYSITAKSAEQQSDPTFLNVEQSRTDWRRLLSNIFLPAGYPTSVSPDYLQYQIFNSLQAFSSSLAGLIASRAVLQGHGVGRADASATHAIFLTVLQDIFSRLTTIIAGYYLGTLLFPEAKSFRLSADIFNDTAIVLDTLSPHLGSLRVASLCLSGACRALCGVVAGGSKTALTVHFANDGRGGGDVGDLNAKDGSKETVLALFGMLSGTVVMHYVHSTQSTYIVLFALIFLHLFCNYLAVRAVVFQSLNRQRANILWMAYRWKPSGPMATSKKLMLTPEGVAAQERIFADPSAVCSHAPDTRTLAICQVGSPFSAISSALPHSELQAILDVFSAENYVLWFETRPGLHSRCTLHVCLKDGHAPPDHVKAWVHAQEVALLLDGRSPRDFEIAMAAVQTAYTIIEDMFPSFIDAARSAGWKVNESCLISGSPRTLRIDVDGGEAAMVEDRKKV